MEEDADVRENRTSMSSNLRLAILSRGPRLYSTRRLAEEARKRGLDLILLIQ